MTATDSGITAEVFLSGCPLCEDALELVGEIAGPDDTVIRHDLSDSSEALERAEELGVSAVPAVALDGRLAACCETDGVEETVLREAGLGVQE